MKIIAWTVGYLAVAIGLGVVIGKAAKRSSEPVRWDGRRQRWYV